MRYEGCIGHIRQYILTYPEVTRKFQRWYGMIPDKIILTKSMTEKHSRCFRQSPAFRLFDHNEKGS